jgi:hypothetical protein
MSEGLQMILNDDGVFEEYDDTYDLTIHCESREEQEEVLNKLNRRWIPCSERMPDDDTIINVIVSGYEVWDGKKTLFVDCATYPGSYIDGFDTDNDWDEGQEVHILAWMPLPEPYGGDEE